MLERLLLAAAAAGREPLSSSGVVEEGARQVDFDRRQRLAGQLNGLGYLAKGALVPAWNASDGDPGDRGTCSIQKGLLPPAT
jgi:hypothetical protein